MNDEKQQPSPEQQELLERIGMACGFAKKFESHRKEGMDMIRGVLEDLEQPVPNEEFLAMVFGLFMLMTEVDKHLEVFKASYIKKIKALEEIQLRRNAGGMS